MSLHKVVHTEAARIGKKGLRSITVTKADNGGLIAEHSMHDYESPGNNAKHIFKNHSALAAHMKKHMPINAKDEDSD